MKIALITDRVNRYGGVPQYVTHLALSLAGDHEVTVFSQTFEDFEDAPLRRQEFQVTDSNVDHQDVSDLAGGGFDIVHTQHYEYPFASDVLTSHYCEAEGVQRLMSRGTNAIFKDAAVRGKSRSKSKYERDLLSTHGGKPLIVLAVDVIRFCQ